MGFFLDWESLTSIFIGMKNRINWMFAILIQSSIATLWSLYYWWFWDPVRNVIANNLFDRSLWYNPCEMCWFARVLMYPIVLISLIWYLKKDRSAYGYIIALSTLWVILETYQYRYQMSHTSSEVESFICGWMTWASCAAIDVVYAGFITIPLLCLIAFIVILWIALYSYSIRKKQW